jgi:hypothetical protein
MDDYKWFKEELIRREEEKDYTDIKSIRNTISLPSISDVHS